MKPGIRFNIESIQPEESGAWIPAFPNPADFRFDYFKLMSRSPRGLATFNTTTPYRIAIVGGGAAGMTVARELFRCGCEVTIFEASDRIGGRLYTHDNPAGQSQAKMEMGAMRMPFFGTNNSLLGYYLDFESAAQYPLRKENFPNPGAAPGNTGIWINEGYGPTMSFDKPTLIPWPMGGEPQDPTLDALSVKVAEFGKKFAIATNLYYTKNNKDWEIYWNKVVNFYDQFTFGDIVVQDSLSYETVHEKVTNLDTFDGNLGGMGMNSFESNLLATIGVGDGSWGAFYYISALWFFRCTYFGFSSNLQTIEKLSNIDEMFVARDSWGNPIPYPVFEGIQSLVEYLYFITPPESSSSLQKSSKLFTRTSVSKIKRNEKGITIDFVYNGEVGTSEFDFAVVTTTQWAAEMSIQFQNFHRTMLPQTKITTQNTQHNISSCKLFFPLIEKYWIDTNNAIPQIIITDTIVQDMYGLSWETKPDDKGVLLASYTWEDDSLKLLPFDEKELSVLVLSKLSQITMQALGQDITRYIDRSKPVTIQWIKEPTYVGCAKLYRTRNEDQNMLDLSYNQNYAGDSKLYFAGENYSVEGGWTEPALRSALDCVVQFVNHNGGTFNDPNFSYKNDYPRWPIVSV